MTEIRHLAGWLRTLAGLAAAAGVLALSACGGGSGAPNNFFKSTMTVLPSPAVAYGGVPTLLTISGGDGPFRVTSSNSGVLPVAQNPSGRTILLLANSVEADTDVTITVQDLGPLQPTAPSKEVVVTVRSAPLVNAFTIVPNLADCGDAVCSGQTALAKVTLRGAQGGLVAGRAIRFDVIGNAYAIVTNNQAQPLASTLTVLTDASGTAAVVIKANANAPTQLAQMSVTDVATGLQLVGNFTIVQITDGSQILTVVPTDVNIKGPFKGVCSSGFVTDYYIYGGTPPYRVASTFPNSITLVNSIVNTNGGFFEAITNGACVDPLTFTIVDATGRQTTATLHNVEGEVDKPVVTPADMTVVPTAVTNPACTNSASNNFIVFGGTPPYNVKPTAGTATPQTIAANGGSTNIIGLTTGSGITTIVFLDSSTPQKSVTATITCS